MIYAVKFVTILHYILGFKTIDFDNGALSIIGPPKIYSIILIVYLTFSNCCFFITDAFSRVINMAPLPTIIFAIHSCTLLLNASISLTMQINVPFERKLKIYENLKHLKTDIIFSRGKKIISHVKFVSFLFMASNMFHSLYTMFKYGDYSRLGTLLISTWILDAFTMQFVIDVLLVTASLEIINSKLLDAFGLKKTDVDFEKTFAVDFKWKNEKYATKRGEIEEILSMMKAYEKLGENAEIISKNICVVVKI